MLEYSLYFTMHVIIGIRTLDTADVIFLTDATCTYKVSTINIQGGANYYLYHMVYIQANVTGT